MPPARARPILDDSRSETSSTLAGAKDKANTGAGIQKSKRTHLSTITELSSGTRAAALNGAVVDMSGTTNGTVQTAGAVQTNWNGVPVSMLHTYRTAYKLQTPSAYAYPHAELLYKASSIGQRAPSQVLARKTMRELKSHRRKLAHINGQASGIHKRFKQKDRDEASSESSQNVKKKVKDANANLDTSIAQSIEPSSPTIVSQSAASTSDHASSTLLNASDPEATIIGRQSPTSLATTIRKHFNAQQLNEAETIARFTYVVRQHGHGSGATTRTSSNAANTINVVGNNFAPTQSISTPIRIEGSAGDGDGWIMGSMGRQVRMSDTGGGAAFRLRFRP